jgi:hypothetical protein
VQGPAEREGLAHPDEHHPVADAVPVGAPVHVGDEGAAARQTEEEVVHQAKVIAWSGRPG